MAQQNELFEKDDVNDDQFTKDLAKYRKEYNILVGLGPEPGENGTAHIVLWGEADLSPVHNDGPGTPWRFTEEWEHERNAKMEPFISILLEERIKENKKKRGIYE